MDKSSGGNPFSWMEQHEIVRQIRIEVEYPNRKREQQQ